jgi:hypothetical protein
VYPPESLQPASILQVSHGTWSGVHEGDGIVIQHHDLIVTRQPICWPAANAGSLHTAQGPIQDSLNALPVLTLVAAIPSMHQITPPALEAVYTLHGPFVVGRKHPPCSACQVRARASCAQPSRMHSLDLGITLKFPPQMLPLLPHCHSLPEHVNRTRYPSRSGPDQSGGKKDDDQLSVAAQRTVTLASKILP